MLDEACAARRSIMRAEYTEAGGVVGAGEGEEREKTEVERGKGRREGRGAGKQ
jgi:hypothetical protein